VSEQTAARLPIWPDTLSDPPQQHMRIAPRCIGQRVKVTLVWGVTPCSLVGSTIVSGNLLPTSAGNLLIWQFVFSMPKLAV
jgi:hypothetical protein